MPRPRFDKLPADRRHALLEAAAREFSAHGFDDASLNRILEQAGVSKGVAYYYFDDKEDLFLTVVRYYLDLLGIGNFEHFPDTLTADNFWSEIVELYRLPFMRSLDHAWAFGIWRVAGEVFRTKPHGALAQFFNSYIGVLERMLKRGQDLGLIRTDLPDELLVSWARAIDDANDRWVLAHWDELDRAALSAAADRLVDGLRRLIGTDDN